MSFDDRLRDELRKATASQPLDAERALRDVRATNAEAPDEPVAVPLVDVEVPRQRRVRTQRLVGVAAAIMLVLGAVAIPFALRDEPHDNARKKNTDPTTPDRSQPLIDRAALQAVASALDATTGAGSFNVKYSMTETPPTAPTTTTCTAIRQDNGMVVLPEAPPPAGASIPPRATIGTAEFCGGSSPHNVITTGTATVNVSPYAMKADSDVSTFGPVTVWVDDTNYWQSNGPPTDVAPTNPGSPISSFAGLVQSTLGPREGANAMMGLASPTGYLSITRDAITGAQPAGTGRVNGEPVTNYTVNVDPALLAKIPGLSAEQSSTINAALEVMQREGFTRNTTDVSINAAGFVVHTKSVNSFADGGRVVSENTFSNFGCAGAVQMPGRPVRVDVRVEVTKCGLTGPATTVPTDNAPTQPAQP